MNKLSIYAGKQYVAHEPRKSISVHLCRVRGKAIPFSVYHSKAMVVSYIPCGTGLFVVNNKKYRFHRNSVLVSLPGAVLCCVSKRKARLERICLSFPTEMIHPSLSNAAFENMTPVLQLSEKHGTQIEMFLRMIEDELSQRHDCWREKIAGTIQLLLWDLYRYRHQKVHPERYDPVSKHALEYVEQHFREPITRMDVAEQFDISPRHVFRLFQNAVGIGLQEYIVSRKIAEAKQLLVENSALKITTIAQEVAMGSLRTFNRDFRRVTGMTPSEYRLLMCA